MRNNWLHKAAWFAFMGAFDSPANQCLTPPYGQVFYCPTEAFYVSALLCGFLYSFPLLSSAFSSFKWSENCILAVQCPGGSLGQDTHWIQCKILPALVLSHCLSFSSLLFIPYNQTFMCKVEKLCRTQLAAILSLLEIGLSLSYVDIFSSSIYAPSR